MVTPKARSLGLPPHPPNTPQTPRVSSSSSRAYPFPGQILNSGPDPIQSEPTVDSDDSVHNPSSTSVLTTSTADPDATTPDSLRLLSSLRHSFQRIEQSLYTELSHTPGSSLNDVRRSFHTAAKGATRRLVAWQTKHTPGSAKAVKFSSATDPGWWDPECHPVPGGQRHRTRE